MRAMTSSDLTAPILSMFGPDSRLQKGENIFLTICCGNSFLQWAAHSALNHQYGVYLNWRTPHLCDDELFEEGDPIEILDLNLVQDIRTYLFGTMESSRKAAELEAEKRGFQLSVYMIGSNVQQLQKLAAVISAAVPSRIFHLSQVDFFSEMEGLYPTMGLDRLAALAGAAHLGGHPTFVIDGGTMLTYTATDCQGHILGGGISSGFLSRFRAMKDHTVTLPLVSVEELNKRLENALQSKKPLPMFARDTKDAMIHNVLAEVSLSLLSSIDLWLETVGESTISSRPRTVYITGGSGDLLMNILRPQRCRIIQLSESLHKHNKFEFIQQQCLTHIGIAAVVKKTSLAERVEKLPLSFFSNDAISPFARSFLNRPVAKKVGYGNSGIGDYKLGVVSNVTQEDDEYVFHLTYDDGCKDQVDVEELKRVIENRLIVDKPRAPNNDPTFLLSESDHEEKASIREEPTKKQTVKDGRQNRRVERSHSPRSESVKTKKTKDMKKSNRESIQKMLEEPRKLIGRRIMKYFVDDNTGELSPFFGTIVKYEHTEDRDKCIYPHLWHVSYDDGDGEELEQRELCDLLNLYADNKADDPESH